MTVSRGLTAEYGRGFSVAVIARMIRNSQLFPDGAIVVTLSQQLSGSHFHALLPIKDPLARDFYAEMWRIEHWDVRTLRQKIDGMLFQTRSSVATTGTSTPPPPPTTSTPTANTGIAMKRAASRNRQPQALCGMQRVGFAAARTGTVALEYAASVLA